ncbi:hypothetical protein TSUD_283790, partial [Trifolium subterraneum]
MGGGGSRLGATKRGDGGDWVTVQSRRRRAYGQEVRGWDWQRHGERLDEDRDGLHGRGFSRGGFRRSSGSRRPDRDALVGRSCSRASREGVGYAYDRMNDIGSGYADGRMNGIESGYAGGQRWKTSYDCGTITTGSSYKQLVTFYFTNFPEHIQHFYLRKAFEVCGIMEHVYVAKKLNSRGDEQQRREKGGRELGWEGENLEGEKMCASMGVGDKTKRETVRATGDGRINGEVVRVQEAEGEGVRVGEVV